MEIFAILWPPRLLFPRRCNAASTTTRMADNSHWATPCAAFSNSHWATPCAAFSSLCIFSRLFQVWLTLPVQLIAWKASSPKWLVICWVERDSLSDSPDTKLYCQVTERAVCENNLPRVVTWQWNDRESNPWSPDHDSWQSAHYMMKPHIAVKMKINIY